MRGRYSHQGGFASDVPINSKIRLAFDLINVRGAPPDPGVYVLWEDVELLYYGLALGGDVTIRSSLKDHLLGLFGACTARATHYNWELCRDPVRREAELLKEYFASFKRLPRCNSRVG